MNGLTFSSVVVCYKNTNQIYLLSVENYKVDIVFKERPFRFNLKRQKRNNARAYTGLEITARPTARGGLFLRRAGAKPQMSARWSGKF